MFELYEINYALSIFLAIHSIGDVAKMPQLPADAAEVLKKASLDVAQ